MTPEARGGMDAGAIAGLVAEILECLEKGRSVRCDLPIGGRIHVDRALPFLCVHATDSNDRAADEVARANAAYLVTPDLAAAVPIINALARVMRASHGVYIVVEVDELERDQLLSDDSPYLPPFEVIVTHQDGPAGRAAFDAFATALGEVEVKYRSPQLEGRAWPETPVDWTTGLDPELARLRVAFAPIYRQPETEKVYPALRERVVTNIFDAVLRAVAAHLEATGAIKLATHRALGRRVFIEAVGRLDQKIDRVAKAFDFLLAVTPINADAAWNEFKAAKFQRTPRFLYRPLALEIDAEKRRLFAIRFDNLEDPLLDRLFREKQQELDLQLTVLAMRDTRRCREASRVLYGPVAPGELAAARAALRLAPEGPSIGESGREGSIDCHVLEREARRMIAGYRAALPRFAARVELRSDLPGGMMVSGPCLFISRSTAMSRNRVQPLLHHEVGVHLFTYFTGDAQGLRLFRSGLAGYEGVQEGLAVFAEYLAGGMTLGRLRLIAGRVVGCAAMLDGAELPETFRLLTTEHGFSAFGAFGIVLRLYRSGGFAKDAIYLRGLMTVLEHLRQGGTLDPFWIGKIAMQHLPMIEELSARGLLHAPPIRPTFLSHPGAGARLKAAREGLAPLDLIAA